MFSTHYSFRWDSFLLHRYKNQNDCHSLLYECLAECLFLCLLFNSCHSIYDACFYECFSIHVIVFIFVDCYEINKKQSLVFFRCFYCIILCIKAKVEVCTFSPHKITDWKIYQVNLIPSYKFEIKILDIQSTSVTFNLKYLDLNIPQAVQNNKLYE